MHVLLAQRFAKNTGLFGETSDKDEATRVQSKIKILIRPMYNVCINRLRHGDRVATEVSKSQKRSGLLIQ